MGWVGSTVAKVLKFYRITPMHLEHGQIRFGCTEQLNLLVGVCLVGLGQSVDGLGWIGSQEMDPQTTLRHAVLSPPIPISTSADSVEFLR